MATTSAGIIVYRKNHKNSIDILLGLVNHYNSLKWTILGGRKEWQDSVERPETDIETALREFDEETAGIFKEMFIQKDMKNVLENSYSILLNKGKYRLFFVEAEKFDLNRFLENPKEN